MTSYCVAEPQAQWLTEQVAAGAAAEDDLTNILATGAELFGR